MQVKNEVFCIAFSSACIFDEVRDTKKREEMQVKDEVDWMN